MREFEHIIGGIYRLKVPFEDLYTSVFLIKTEQGNALVDCATYDRDVDDYIIPALAKIGLKLTDMRYLILTHEHGDHAGGKKRIVQLNPQVEIIKYGRQFALNGVTVCEMKGHTMDCIGVLDERSQTLISGDGLQGAGVGKYRCSIANKNEYLKTIERVERDKRIQNILFSHAYEPWYKDGAFGREEVEKILKEGENYALLKSVGSNIYG